MGMCCFMYNLMDYMDEKKRADWINIYIVQEQYYYNIRLINFWNKYCK
jgi:hypothetical protein